MSHFAKATLRMSPPTLTVHDLIAAKLQQIGAFEISGTAPPPTITSQAPSSVGELLDLPSYPNVAHCLATTKAQSARETAQKIPAAPV
jgi:hypothetical protein